MMSAEDRRGAAVAVWRMAMLLGGLGPDKAGVFLRVGEPADAALLANAGECLGVMPSVDRVADGWVVAAHQPGQVFRLLTQTGAGDAARLWARHAAKSPT
jgi:hypothetical protein